jgi:hypothetical protein
MIRSRLSWILLLAAIALVLTAGCSSRKGKVLGNERLLRGDGGFGTTERTFSAPDRDTYVSTGDVNLGQTLVVGFDQSIEARAYFARPDQWVLPDTLHVGVSILSITFQIPIDVLARNDADGLAATLATTVSEYDSIGSWPGPQQDLTIGTAPDASVAPFRIDLPLSVYPLIEAWAADPDSLRGLVLYPAAGNGLVGFEAGKATLSIAYSHDVGGVTEVDTVVTAFPHDHYRHTPPSPTGADASLILGGISESGVALRFPPVAVPEGYTVNEATLLLHVDTSAPPFTADQSAPLLVRQLRASWPESATDTTMLGPDAAVYVTTDSVSVRTPADSVLTIVLPQSVVRQWAAAGAMNEGILITMANANRLPEIRIGARESARPAELRVSITGPPPGRF